MGRLKKFKLDSDTDMVQLCTAFPAHSRCRVLHRNADWSTSGQQEFSWSQKDIPVQEPFTAKKQKPTRKRRCSQCETHAQTSFVDRQSREKPLSDRVRQLSVGVPTAIAPERAIAAHLRQQLCAANEECAKLFDVLPRDSWQQHKLLRGLLNLVGHCRVQEQGRPTLAHVRSGELVERGPACRVRFEPDGACVLQGVLSEMVVNVFWIWCLREKVRLEQKSHVIADVAADIQKHLIARVGAVEQFLEGTV
jgi:hypothetical protein